MLGSPLGSYIGGKVLNLSPLMKHGQLHNYTLVFTIGGAANLIALIWVLIRVNEKKDIKEFKKRFHIRDDSDIEPKGRTVDCEKQKQLDDNKHIHPLRLLFSLGNVKDMIRTCCKPRANYVRLQIWLLFLTMFFYMVTHIGIHAFLYPFCQKIYEWDSETYSSANAMGNAINAMSTLILAPILIKVV